MNRSPDNMGRHSSDTARFSRRTLRLAVLIGMVALVPIFVVGCFRGNYVIDHIDISRHTIKSAWGLRIGSGHDHLFLYWTYQDLLAGGYPLDQHEPGWEIHFWQDRDLDAPEFVPFLHWQAGSGRALGYHSFDLSVGYPLLILLDVGLLIWWILRWRKGRREWLIDHEICGVCGYDLRATPDRCPECGTIPLAAKGAAT